MKSIEQLALFVLCENFFENKDSENTISRDHPKTDACCTNLSFNYLSLFVL